MLFHVANNLKFLCLQQALAHFTRIANLRYTFVNSNPVQCLILLWIDSSIVSIDSSIKDEIIGKAINV